MEGVVLSTLRSLGITRAELKSANARNDALPMNDATAAVSTVSAK